MCISRILSRVLPLSIVFVSWGFIFSHYYFPNPVITAEMVKEARQSPKKHVFDELRRFFTSEENIEESKVLTEAEDAKQHPETLYLCLLCSLCQEVCPLGLKIDELMLALRQQLVEEGLGPLPQHRLVRRDQEWSTSDAVTLAQPDPQARECRYAFFPGCALSGYSPELVIQVYDYLREKLPGTGIILNCCGSPTHFLGDSPRFEEILAGVESEMKRLGASGLIVACPDCYHTIKHNAPHLKLKSVYEDANEHTIPGLVASIEQYFEREI